MQEGLGCATVLITDQSPVAINVALQEWKSKNQCSKVLNVQIVKSWLYIFVDTSNDIGEPSFVPWSGRR